MQMTDMIGVGTVAVVEVVVALDRLGVRVTGSVTDAELTTLPPGAAAMHAEQTKPLKEGTEVQIGVTGVMATEEVEVMVIVEVEGEVIEEPLLSSLGTGTAQTALPTTLQADKHATNVVAKSEQYLMQHLFCQNCLCRLAGTVLAALSAWLWVQLELGFLWCWCPSLGFGVGWLLGSWLNCLGSGTCISSGFGKGWSGVTDLQQDAVAVAFWGVLRLRNFGVLHQVCKQ